MVRSRKFISQVLGKECRSSMVREEEWQVSRNYIYFLDYLNHWRVVISLWWSSKQHLQSFIPHSSTRKAQLHCRLSMCPHMHSLLNCSLSYIWWWYIIFFFAQVEHLGNILHIFAHHLDPINHSIISFSVLPSSHLKYYSLNASLSTDSILKKAVDLHLISFLYRPTFIPKIILIIALL